MNAIGIIPAAGKGTRLHPFRYPKELFPIGYSSVLGNGAGVQLKVTCQYTLECLVAASVRRAYVVVSDHKFEIMRFLSDGQEFDISLAYLHQREINGLPFAIDCAYDWVRDDTSVLVLPDTIVEPATAVRQLLDLLRRSQADVALGVFPTSHPEMLCPVRFDGAGRVLALHDKDPRCDVRNTWGLAVWTPSFAEFLHQYLRKEAAPGREMALAEVFTQGLADGLEMVALPVPGGRFWDIGTNASLIEARQAFEDRMAV